MCLYINVGAETDVTMVFISSCHNLRFTAFIEFLKMILLIGISRSLEIKI